ncbi:signal peptidase II [Labilibacter marinus]|uniref:signal peptidase II n=1 Tax=Labilibacter marinus TaxID=1477105 RepID=UPI00082A61F0|nr:signal peptidase II [Labilibacter marinus]
MSKKIRNLILIVLLISNVACDQITKEIVRDRIEYNSRISVVGDYLILTKVENTGAFLGLGNSIPRWLYKITMIALPLLAMIYGLYILFRKSKLSFLLCTGIAFIIGGGVGNIIDRILFGSVTDFLFFDFVLFHTGIVNMADISVTLGFFIILYESFIQQRKLKSSAV